jgi:hypothetical protein
MTTKEIVTLTFSIGTILVTITGAFVKVQSMAANTDKVIGDMQEEHRVEIERINNELQAANLELLNYKVNEIKVENKEMAKDIDEIKEMLK